MTPDEALKSFRDVEQSRREGYNAILGIKLDRKLTVRKHEARNYAHLVDVLKEADVSCPRAADTIRWLLWHEITHAQWAMHMVEMTKFEFEPKEKNDE